MLKACPRCRELVLDNTMGVCIKCLKKFAPDRLPPLNKFEAGKLLMDRQKERAKLMASEPRPVRFAWLRFPLMAIGWLLALLAAFFLLHLLVMDLAANLPITAAVALLSLFFGYLSTAALSKSRLSLPLAGGRLAEVERDVRLLEDELEKLKAEK